MRAVSQAEKCRSLVVGQGVCTARKLCTEHLCCVSELLMLLSEGTWLFRRDRRKQEKYLARNAAKLEAERKAAEEAAAAAAAEAAAATAAGEAKKLRQVERKAMQKERSRLRNICGTPRERLSTLHVNAASQSTSQGLDRASPRPSHRVGVYSLAYAGPPLRATRTPFLLRDRHSCTLHHSQCV